MPKFHPTERANVIADCLEIQFTPHIFCDENHNRPVEATVQVLPEDVENSRLQSIRPRDLQKLILFLNRERSAELMTSQMNASGTSEGGEFIKSLPSASSKGSRSRNFTESR
jgi:hypothetical protein